MARTVVALPQTTAIVSGVRPMGMQGEDRSARPFLGPKWLQIGAPYTFLDLTTPSTEPQ